MSKIPTCIVSEKNRYVELWKQGGIYQFNIHLLQFMQSHNQQTMMINANFPTFRD